MFSRQQVLEPTLQKPLAADTLLRKVREVLDGSDAVPI
jgi:hypothetical protein